MTFYLVPLRLCSRAFLDFLDFVDKMQIVLFFESLSFETIPLYSTIVSPEEHQRAVSPLRLFIMNIASAGGGRRRGCRSNGGDKCYAIKCECRLWRNEAAVWRPTRRLSLPRDGNESAYLEIGALVFV